MNTVAGTSGALLTVLFLLAAALAVVDWVAVGVANHRIELAAKPVVLVVLVVIASVADMHHGVPRGWVVAALVLGLGGDIGLMLSPSERADEAGEPDPAFMAGLGSFLLGHLCWVVAFVAYGQRLGDVIAGLVVVTLVAVFVLRRVVIGAARTGGTALAVAVSAYAVALSAMVVTAHGTGPGFTALGGLLFLASDATLSWDRFVGPVRRGKVIVIVTYHLAQALLLAGLIR